MKRFPHVTWLLALLLGATHSHSVMQAAESETASGKKLPNIVLCMTDDQGYGDVGYYGASPVQTPVLDELAQTALRFDRFYAAAPVCSPTRGSVLTGRHPNRFECFSWGHHLKAQELTIAKALKKAGYTTGHFGKWHLGSLHPESPVSPGESGFDEWLSSPNFYENDPVMCHNGEVISTKGESSQVPVDYAIQFMKTAQEKDQPFLAVIWFGSPHVPHEATDELKALYPDFRPALANFFGEITGADRAVGNVRQALREMKIEKETLLWFNSDNGVLPVGSSAGLRGKKGDLWEGGIRVPALIEWPGVTDTPRIINEPCSTVDILPTLLDLAGLPQESSVPLDGQSLLPLIKGEEFQRENPLGFWVYPMRGQPVKSTDVLLQLKQDLAEGKPFVESERMARNPADNNPRNPVGHAALIDGPWKLHRLPLKKKGRYAYELFHLDDDRAEQLNIAPEHPERVLEMQEKLAAWQASVLNSMNEKDYPAEKAD